MSAIHLSANHIAAMLGSVGPKNIEMQVDAAAMLASANAKSIAARYRESFLEPVEVKASHINYYVLHPLSPAALLKAIASFEYQSCEFEGWNESLAQVICSELRSEAIRMLSGYAEAEWIID
jgi:hypothetical protein